MSEICLVDNVHNTIHISICVDFLSRLYLLKFWCLIAGAGRAVWKDDKTDAVASIDALIKWNSTTDLSIHFALILISGTNQKTQPRNSFL